MRSLASALVLFYVAVFVSSHVLPSSTTFEEFMKKYEKQYNAQEYKARKSIYQTRVSKIEAHNKEGTAKHSLGINHMTDWTDEELSSLFGLDMGMALRTRMLRNGTFPSHSQMVNISRLPQSVDWTKKGAVSPVKNQGGCGSCWSFAGTEAIESALYLATGQLDILSPQVYVDCVQNPQHCGGTGGCGGATPDLLFQYAEKQGAFLEKDYPYRGSDETCKVSSAEPVANITGYKDVLSNNAAALMAAVAQQPVTIGVAANEWLFYSGGILQFEMCGAELNHAVLLVGYGTDAEGNDYWKVQNSWGSSWGEDGFILLERSSNDDTNCKTDKAPKDGFGCDGGPSTISVCGTCGLLYLPSYPTGAHLV